MQRRDFDIDHIDPRWEEGRDYQMVCGLDCPLNYREEDPSINSAKSNRFLPWRWSREELGVVPEEPGDLAQFLVNGEWVLMEFLSEEWFEATRETCGEFQPYRQKDELGRSLKSVEMNRVLHADRDALGRSTHAVKAVKKLHSEKDDSGRSKIGVRLNEVTHAEKDELGRSKHAVRVAAKLHSMKYKCLVTGKVSTAGPLSLYQKSKGIDTSLRVRIQ